MRHSSLLVLLIFVPVVCHTQDWPASALLPSTSSLINLAAAGLTLPGLTSGQVPVCHPHQQAPAVALQPDLPGSVPLAYLGSVAVFADCRTGECGQGAITTTAHRLPLILTLPTPALIPTEGDFCPDQATLTEEIVDDARLYRCFSADGLLLWEKTWCPEVPKATARIAAPACTGEGFGGELLGYPHFYCDLTTLTWRLQCRDPRDILVWDTAL